MTSLPPEDRFPIYPHQPTGAERTRLSAIGELSFRIGTLMETLQSQDMLAQKDQIFEFPTIDESALPEVFKKNKVDSVTVMLGALHQNDTDQTTPLEGGEKETSEELYISLLIQSDDKTLCINRTTDPYRDPAEAQDVIRIQTPNSSDPVIIPLDTDISNAEFNTILVALVGGSPSTQALLSHADFLNPYFYTLLNEVLDSEAPQKGYRGIHIFEDGDAELEFSKVDTTESFKITYVDRSKNPPRTIAAAAASSLHFDMRFFTSQALDIREPVIPDTADTELLVTVTENETDRLRQQIDDQTRPLSITETDKDQTQQTAQQNIFNDRVTQIAIEESLREMLDQDGLDPPNAGA